MTGPDEKQYEGLAQRVYAELARNPAKALRLAEEGLRLARKSPASRFVARMTLCRAHALRECGRLPEALADYDRAARTYRRHGETVEAWRTAIGKIDALHLSGAYRNPEETYSEPLGSCDAALLRRLLEPGTVGPARDTARAV